MPNEIKTMSPEIVPDKDKPTFDLPVLTVDKDSDIPSDREREESSWHELKNAYITRRILTGHLTGMETTPNDNRVVGLTFYEGHKIIIPAQELIEKPTEKNPDNTSYMKIISSMIGAEISYMIIALDNNTQTVVASRLKANERNIQTFFFDKDEKGRYKIYEDSIVEARIIGLGRSSVRAEIFGAICTIRATELSWDWITDISEQFSIGDRVMVRITSIKGRDNQNIPFAVEASIRLAQSSKQEELLETVHKGNIYTGKIVDIRKGTFLIKLTNGSNALAHCSHSRRDVLRNDTVAFVVNHVDHKTLMITGQIIRIVKRERRFR